MVFSTKESIFQSPEHWHTFIYEVGKHLRAFLGMQNFRMELYWHTASFPHFPLLLPDSLSVWAVISNPGAAFEI